MKKELILCKVRFFINNSVVADLVAAVSPDDKNPKETLVKELYGNYTADNDLAYTEKTLKDAISSSAYTQIGYLEPTDHLVAETDDFCFIQLHRTENWKIK